MSASAKRSIDHPQSDNLSGSKIARVEDEKFSCVILKSDGTYATDFLGPHSDELIDEKTLLGYDEVVYLGGWKHMDLHMVGTLDHTDENIPLNKHELQPPYHNKQYRGDIIIFKLNYGERVDLTIEEYEEFLAEDKEEWEDIDENSANEEGDDFESGEYSEGDEDEDEDGANFSQFYDSISKKVMEIYDTEFGDEVDEEKAEFLSTLMNFVQEHIRDINPAEEMDTDELSQDLFTSVTEKLIANLNRDLDDTEKWFIEKSIDITVQMLSGGDESTGNEDFAEYMTTQLTETFREQHGRSPNPDEMEDIIERSAQLAEEAAGAYAFEGDEYDEQGDEEDGSGDQDGGDDDEDEEEEGDEEEGEEEGDDEQGEEEGGDDQDDADPDGTEEDDDAGEEGEYGEYQDDEQDEDEQGDDDEENDDNGDGDDDA
jgi:hypothetical protein